MKRTLRIAAPVVTAFALFQTTLAEEPIKIAQSFLQENRILHDMPEEPINFAAVHSQIAAQSDSESKFGYAVFSIARHGNKLLNETQREQLDNLIKKRSDDPINWHDVRNIVRVKAQIALWNYAGETDPTVVEKRKSTWQEWNDLRIAYMEQEFLNKEAFQRAAWNILTEANKKDLLSGKWNEYLKKNTGHSRHFSADKQIRRLLGKPDHPDDFNDAEAIWRKRWDIMWEKYEAASLFERKREFSMDLADEAFSISSWKKHYVPAFRAFSEHECEAIRELLQRGYENDNEAQEKLKTFREKLRSGAVEKYVEAPEKMRALFH